MYLEMPGLRLTLDQAQRRFGGQGMLCRMMGDAPVKAKFLCVHSNGTCARLIDRRDLLPSATRESRSTHQSRQTYRDGFMSKPRALIAFRRLQARQVKLL
jgi:hypothetical protein